MNVKTSLLTLTLSLAAAALATAAPVRVLILTGQHNHNWRETTPRFQAIYKADNCFAVEVTETPWTLTPADLDRYDVLVSNWNTFGKRDAPVWDAAMKAAFLKWIGAGKGFVVIHAGGSLYYDWPEFQKLIGATWDKGTYHPKQQEFTVEITAPDHPITRGIEAFTVFDEPWQKMVVNNPAAQVLARAVIPQDQGGTGEPEPMAFAVEYGGGRCFNLVLGHTQQVHAHPVFGELLRRGTKWAASLKTQ